MSTIVDGFTPSPTINQPRLSALFGAREHRSLHQDLTTFFGQHAQVYLDVHTRMRSAAQDRRRVRAWSWPVFLGSFTWFFYRKMYLYGSMMIFMPLVLSYLFGSVGSVAMSIMFATSAKSWYVKRALDRIAKADRLGLIGAERSSYLQRAGGVSWAGGILAGLIYGFILLIVVLNAFARHKVGHA